MSRFIHNIDHKHVNKRAFTLAEVLITLGIIGVVAVLTIQSLVNNVVERQTVESFMTAHSILNNAFKQYATDNGCVGDLKTCGLFDGDADAASFQKVWDGMKGYFVMSQDCGLTTGLGCFNKGFTTRQLDGTLQNSYDNAGSGKAVLNNGMSILIEDLAGNCNTAACKSVASGSVLCKTCGNAVVDINGIKAPNQKGRDQFTWWVTSSGAVLPLGTPQDANYATAAGVAKCDKDGDAVDKRGTACGAKILMENAVNY